jgi:hypothetical protein
MIETNGKFYLGRLHDLQSAATNAAPLLYDPADLTTHAVVVGMTGSGKTGLCLTLLEEAALNRIPALLIDPKGDITNALLHFPNLAPADFLPWINADQARRDGKTVEQAAEATAVLWRDGLAQWDIPPERLQTLKESVRFTVYTPGSDAGVPLSILASLAAPPIPWESNKELLREKISGAVTALLGLIGLTNIDPVRSREHILLANIFEHAWSRGQDLDLGELIMQTQTPPFDKLGVFDVNRFFPEKDRFELAMLLNNILAAPAFQSWINGEPLDAARLLYHADGTPRHSIFYIAHLPEAERMFFVTLLYSAVESWMRAQSGTTSLRALIYFDELFGYLPPVGNPPSKQPILRMLKQARAFGVGLVLATQNPVDLDYKALSNAGTWFIGKLGTEQDKQRLLDGLSSAMPDSLDRQTYDRLISAIGKRVFLLRNIHAPQPILFQTRWAMNYLAGPVTRAQIPALNALAGVGEQLTVNSEQLTVNEKRSTENGLQVTENVQPVPRATRPTIPAGLAEYFLPVNVTLMAAAQKHGRSLAHTASATLLYRPVLLVQTNVHFVNRKYNLDTIVQRAVLVAEPDERGLIRWETYETRSFDDRQLRHQPAPDSQFASPENALSNGRVLTSLTKDFLDWAYRTTEVVVQANERLKVYAGPEVSAARFSQMCETASADSLTGELDKVTTTYKKRIERLEERLARARRELREDEAELANRKQDELATHARTFMGLFGRRRSLSSSLTKRRQTAEAGDDVTESKKTIAEFEADIAQLTRDMSAAQADVRQKWAAIAAEKTAIKVTPFKKDVTLALFGIAWLPFHRLQTGDEVEDLPAFTQGI